MTATSLAANGTGAARPAGMRTEKRDALTATAFVAPAMLGFGMFVIVPALAGLVLSFYEWDLFADPEFVGLDNFRRLLVDPDMWQSLWVTASFVVMGVIPTIIVGFLAAVLINVRLPAIGAVRILYFAPMIASSAVAALIWSMIYSPNAGLLRQLLGAVGLVGPNWLSDTTWARPALVVIMIWGALPLVIILYLAGLQRVPEDIYAAASLDGASAWRQVWSMTWPSVWPTTLLVAVLLTISFVSGSFEMALILTDGGPLGATRSLALYSYIVAFSNREIGYASALSFFQLLVMAGVVVAVYAIRRLLRSR